jgi:hypothetical protein
MKVRVYVLDVSVPRWLRYALVAGIPAVVLATTALVRADVKNVFGAGDPLSSAKLNENFKALADAVTKLETKKLVVTNPANGKSISVGALYCGVTPAPIIGSAIGGYEAAAQSCRAAVGCQSSPSVHMCTSEELLRSRSVGIEIPSSWYSTGSALVSFYNTTEHGLNDCTEWTSGVANQQGSQWKAGGSPGPGFAGCASPAPIACCD